MNKRKARNAIRVRVEVDSETKCWLWVKGVNAGGYGQINFDGKVWLAHRLSYTAFRENIPESLIVRHLCNTTRCCNPNHLSPGTHNQNMQDAIEHNPNVWVDRPNQNASLTEEDVAHIKLRLELGDTGKGLAKKFGVGASAITNIKKGRTWKNIKPKHPSPEDTSEQNQAKLTEKDVAHIKLQFSLGVSTNSLAKKFGRSVSALRNIRIGKTWKNIKPFDPEGDEH